MLDETGIEYFAYADDLTIVQRIRTDLDRLKFEAILDTLQTWAEKYSMKWSPLKTQRLVFKYQGCREPHSPKEIYFGGKAIIPLETSAISLGVLIIKNCVFLGQIKKVSVPYKSEK